MSKRIYFELYYNSCTNYTKLPHTSNKIFCYNYFLKYQKIIKAKELYVALLKFKDPDIGKYPNIFLCIIKGFI